VIANLDRLLTTGTVQDALGWTIVEAVDLCYHPDPTVQAAEQVPPTKSGAAQAAG
jgi:hypothetical protein